MWPCSVLDGPDTLRAVLTGTDSQVKLDVILLMGENGSCCQVLGNRPDPQHGRKASWTLPRKSSVLVLAPLPLQPSPCSSSLGP